MDSVVASHPSWEGHTREYVIDHSNPTAVVPRKTFEVLLWTFVGMAIVAIFSRFAIRFKTRQKLFLDDYLLIPALLSLCAAAAALYHALPAIFLIEAMRFRQGIFPQAEEFMPLLESMKWMHVFLCTIWTCIFCVKYSFLAFFHGMIAQVSVRLSRYFWFVVGYSIIMHCFLVSEPFILCHSYGANILAHCFPEPFVLTLSLTIVITVIDIIGDLMIISIPLLVLSMTGLSPQQKAVMGSFLCLSSLMVVMAGIRLAEYHAGNRTTIDLVWAMFWQFMEGAVAALMASLTVYRAIFVHARRRASERKYQEYKRQNRQRSLLRWSPRKKRHNNETASTTTYGMPHIPGATMTGMQSFVNNNNRTIDSHTLSAISHITSQTSATYKQSDADSITEKSLV